MHKGWQAMRMHVPHYSAATALTRQMSGRAPLHMWGASDRRVSTPGRCGSLATELSPQSLHKWRASIRQLSAPNCVATQHRSQMKSQWALWDAEGLCSASLPVLCFTAVGHKLPDASLLSAIWAVPVLGTNDSCCAAGQLMVRFQM